MLFRQMNLDISLRLANRFHFFSFMWLSKYTFNRANEQSLLNQMSFVKFSFQPTDTNFSPKAWKVQKSDFVFKS